MTTDTSTPRTQLFIADAFADASDGQTFQTWDPARGRVVADVALAGAEDVDRAVTAARAALDGAWGALGLDERGRILRRIAALLDERAEELAALESLDAGKPLGDALVQVRTAATWFDWFADMATRVRSHVIPGLAGHLNYTLREPHGVVACIVPWNYPMALYGVKVAPALAMGNAVLLKPAEQTPLSALALADVCRDAGLPEGALSVLPGDGPTTGRAIVDHPGVRMVSFTGSTVVGQEIAARGAATMKKVTLELGGKSPNVVFADADLDVAVDAALFSVCVNAGQLCSAGTRLLVEQQVHDEVLERLVSRARALTVGDPSAAGTQLGAIITPEQLARIESYVALGRQEGARLVTGGARPSIAGCEDGWFFEPTIFAGVRNEMRLAQEEIFGPVLSVLPFADEQDAVRIANDVVYGLAAGVWTTSLARAHRMASAIQAGLVYVNTMNLLLPGSPYSGYKQSGVGVEGGVEQAESFTQLKSVWVNLTDAAPAL